MFTNNNTQEQHLISTTHKTPELFEILVEPDPRLRQVSSRVTEFDESLPELIVSMLFTMEQNNGIGLAAPQINLHKRILIVHVPDKVARYFINPEIIATRGSQRQIEGCLSIPDVFGFPETKRYKSIRVKYQDVHGDEYTQEFNGLEAVCIQHEIDHLDGKLFTDYGLK
jgi:peptide deformylase